MFCYSDVGLDEGWRRRRRDSRADGNGGGRTRVLGERDVIGSSKNRARQLLANKTSTNNHHDLETGEKQKDR